MIATVFLTAAIWIAWALALDKEKADYGVNVVAMMQTGAAVISTLIVWLLYFALT